MRVVDWPQKLNEYIVANRDKPFVLGKTDCCTFVAGAVKAITRKDYMKEFRNTYKTVEDCDKVLVEIGAGSLYRTMRKKFGKPVRGAHGKRGDIAFYDGSIGIIIGKFAIFVGENGSVFVSITKIQRAFVVN